MTNEKDFVWVECPIGYSVLAEENPGHYWYIGDEEEVVIPEKIKNEKLVSYFRMFSSLGQDLEDGSEIPLMKKKVRKIKANSKDVLSTEDMFSFLETEELDLSEMKIPNVLNMNSMFSFAKIKRIDISGLNTEKVKDATEMFFYCDMEEINSSTLVFNKDTIVKDIFEGDFSLDILNLSNLNLQVLKKILHEYELYNVKIKPKHSILELKDAGEKIEFALIFESGYNYYLDGILDSFAENDDSPIGLLSLYNLKDYIYMENLEEITIPVTINLKEIRKDIMKKNGKIAFEC